MTINLHICYPQVRGLANMINKLNKVPENSQVPSSLSIGLLQSRQYHKNCQAPYLKKRSLLHPIRFTIQYLQESAYPSLVL